MPETKPETPKQVAEKILAMGTKPPAMDSATAPGNPPIETPKPVLKLSGRMHRDEFKLVEHGRAILLKAGASPKEVQAFVSDALVNGGGYADALAACIKHFSVE